MNNRRRTNKVKAYDAVIVVILVLMAVAIIIGAVVLCKNTLTNRPGNIPVSTDSGNTTDDIPEVTTSAPDETTNDEELTTSASPDTTPEESTKKPEPITELPETTPEETTQAPIDTTKEVTTKEETTAAPIVNPDQYSYLPIDDAVAAHPSVVLGETADAGEDYLNRIVFLGDSLTYGIKTIALRPAQQVWVPSNGTLLLNNVPSANIFYPEENQEITVASALAKKQPDILVITLGTNGISYLNEAGFKGEFRKIISSVKQNSPNTIIILDSIFPVARSYKLQGSINNVKISNGNRWLIDLAEENGVYYLNSAEALLGPDGYLPENIQSGDGLHFNGRGYNILLDYIRTHAVP